VPTSKSEGPKRPKAESGGDEIALTPEQDAALERAWEKILPEAAAAPPAAAPGGLFVVPPKPPEG
jgi:hypothetical protein